MHAQNSISRGRAFGAKLGPEGSQGGFRGVRQVSKNAESYVKYVSKRMFLICLEKRVETHPSKNTVFYVSKRPFGLPVGVSRGPQNHQK